MRGSSFLKVEGERDHDIFIPVRLVMNLVITIAEISIIQSDLIHPPDRTSPPPEPWECRYLPCLGYPGG